MEVTAMSDRIESAARDRIELRGLRIRGHHGVFEHERLDGQEFIVDAVLSVDVSRAAAADDLADTVDYGSLAHRIAAIVEGEPMNLIETLASRIADVCLDDTRVESVEVRVHKPSAPIPLQFDDVVVVVNRGRAAR
jgi:7,8-dihydroneopterin aldolase/epimerase/oxygenase